MRGGDTPACLQGAHTGALTKVGDDYFAFGSRTRIVRQNRSDVLVRESMKAVAANTRFRKRARKCEGSGNVRLSVMKCCVEAGHLRQVWMQLRQRFDASKVMRLVKRRQRYQSSRDLQLHSRVHDYGCVVLSPAVDNPVSGANEANDRQSGAPASGAGDPAHVRGLLLPRAARFAI